MLKHPAIRIGGVVTLAALAGLVLWRQLDLGTKWTISSRVDDLSHAREIESAHAELMETPRGPTIEALKNAIEAEAGTPWGKVQVLQLLSQFKESRVVSRALDSSSLTTQRAAAYLRQTDAQATVQVGTIAMAWLRDQGSADRRLAVMVLRTLDQREAIPELLKVLEEEGKNPESAAVMVRVLDALGHFKPAGIAPQVLALAADTGVMDAVRSEAMKTLTYLEDTQRAELLALLVSIAQDKKVETNFRHNAVSLLGRPQNATPEAWEVLKAILLDPDNSKQSIQILQRTALRALVGSYPMDKLGELLLDRRVYAHPYFGIRTDVAAGIGTLRLRSRLALQVLTELLVEDDAGDFTCNVPRQAWISFWMVTGFHTGSSRPELFAQPPKPMTDEETLRVYVFSISYGNPTISEEQVKALDDCTLTTQDNELRRDDPGAYRSIRAAKLEKRKAISESLRGMIDRLVEKK